MLVVPIPTEEFLPRVVRAAEGCGYAGLMVVLARTADARAQHEELTREWTSLHDVTGPLLALLCPDPDSSPYGSAVYGPDGAVGVQGLQLQHPSISGRDAFSRSFWDHNYSNMETYDQLSHFGRSRAPLPAEDHHAAWTEAVSRCATYFGIHEALLPAVLILSLWERRAVVIDSRPDFSLYDLSKAVVEQIGPASRQLDLLHQRVTELERSVGKLTKAQASWATSSRRPRNKWRSDVRKIDHLLELTSRLDPALVKRCREGLRRVVLEPGSVDDVLIDLRALHRKLCSQNQYPLKHSALWGMIIGPLEKGIMVPQLEASPYAENLADLTEQFQQARREEFNERLSVNLTAKILAACHRVIGPIDTVQSPGEAALSHWHLHVVRRRPPSPLVSGRKDLVLAGKAVGGAGLTGAVLYLVATVPTHVQIYWPYWLFLAAVVVGIGLYFAGQKRSLATDQGVAALPTLRQAGPVVTEVPGREVRTDQQLDAPG